MSLPVLRKHLVWTPGCMTEPATTWRGFGRMDVDIAGDLAASEHVRDELLIEGRRLLGAVMTRSQAQGHAKSTLVMLTMLPAYSGTDLTAITDEELVSMFGASKSRLKSGLAHLAEIGELERRPLFERTWGRRVLQIIPPRLVRSYDRPPRAAKPRASRSEAAIEAKRRRVADRVERLNAIKLAVGCTDCGYRDHPAALEFDHLPGRAKVGEVGQLARSAAWEVVLEEIKKCQIVCANCHRVRTTARLVGGGK